MKHWHLILLLLAFETQASMESAHQEGQAFGKSLQGEAAQNIKNIDTKQVPGFQTDNPAQTGLSQTGNFNDAINQELGESEAAKALMETSNQRQRYKLDAKTDSIFKSPEEKPAETVLDITEETRKAEQEFSNTVTCEEGGEDVAYQCFQDRHVTRNVPLKTVTLSVNHISFSPRMESYTVQTRSGNVFRHGKWETRYRQKGWTSSLPKEIKAFKATFCQNFNPVDVVNGRRFNIDCSRIKSFEINGASLSEANGVFNIITPGKMLNITLWHDTYEGLPGEETDEWVSGCDAYEKMVEEGLCHYGERVLSQGPETRNIQEYKVYKDAWQYRQKYFCKMIKDECSSLRAKGCHQIGSKCKEPRQGKCWIYEQSYQCPNGRLQGPQFKTSSLQPFCLTGNCQDSSYEQNGEMLDVISRLSLLKQVQDDIRSQQAQGSFQIFKGQDRRCSRNCINFKDCCGGMHGWGVGLHIAACSGEEKELATLREKKLCHPIGSYCAKKVLGKCVTKKTSFCCFSGKFARLLQEQGRLQLGLNWGTPQEPNCRGFTVEELSRLDFSKLDMRELFEELMSKYRAPNVQVLQQKTTEKIQQNLQQLEQNMRQKEIPKTGVIHDNKENL